MLAALTACAPSNAESPATRDAEDTEDADAVSDATGAEEATEPEADPLVVVAKLSAVADLAERVLGDRGTTEMLVPQGADAHTYEPRPTDVARVGEADVFFGVGLALNNTALQMAEENLVDGVPSVHLAEEALGADDYAFEEFGHDHTHDHEDDHDHSHDDEGDHDHSHDDEGDQGAANPHVWVDPANAMAMVREIRDTLIDLDPEGRDDYRANAQTLLDEITTLDEAITEAVETIPPADRKLVVYHDAWAYFGSRYGLEVIAAVQPADMAEPSAAEVREIIDQIRAEDVPKVFGSVEFPSPVLETIAEETGAEYGADLSDDVLPGEPGEPEHSYVGLLQQNARTIVEGLGGDPAAIDRIDLEA